ncbi:MAG: pentapeptide repeat-containing protein [Pseudanabaenaceae cyanobacterium]
MFSIHYCYQVLEVFPGASWEEINQAYRDLLFIWHPDRIPRDNYRLQQKAEAKLKELNQAREILRSYTCTGQGGGEKGKYHQTRQRTETRKTKGDYSGRDLQRVDLRERDFSGRNFSYANLRYADLSDAFLPKTNFHRADLRGAKLFRTNLLQADLSYANLQETNLIGADLSGANLVYADLRGARIGYGNKIMVKLTGANLTGAQLPPPLLRS